MRPQVCCKGLCRALPPSHTVHRQCVCAMRCGTPGPKIIQKAVALCQSTLLEPEVAPGRDQAQRMSFVTNVERVLFATEGWHFATLSCYNRMERSNLKRSFLLDLQ